MNELLPDEAGVFGEETPDGFKMRWLSGAFGDRDTIEGVVRFRVLEDEWEIGEDDVPMRTIRKAEVVD